jgi:hypothetical protein
MGVDLIELAISCPAAINDNLSGFSRDFFAHMYASSSICRVLIGVISAQSLIGEIGKITAMDMHGNIYVYIPTIREDFRIYMPHYFLDNVLFCHLVFVFRSRPIIVLGNRGDVGHLLSSYEYLAESLLVALSPPLLVCPEKENPRPKRQARD